MLTLFFVPKAFEGNFAIIQENAIKAGFQSSNRVHKLFFLEMKKELKMCV